MASSMPLLPAFTRVKMFPRRRGEREIECADLLTPSESAACDGFDPGAGLCGVSPAGGNFHLPPSLNLLPNPSRLQLTPNRSSVPAIASASISGAPAPSGVHMGELSAEETGDGLRSARVVFSESISCALHWVRDDDLCSGRQTDKQGYLRS